MPRQKRDRKRKAVHDMQALTCPLCTELYGTPKHCVKDYSEITAHEQRDWYERTGHCGRCGQRAGTHRTLCKCRGLCGCWELHSDVSQGIDDQESLF